MELFTWNNSYSVNNIDLDNHHKKLFEIFNILYDSCVNKNKKITLGTIVEELVSYIIYHFHAEEQYLLNINYQNINEHISEHRHFTAIISKYHQNKNRNDIVVSKEIVLYLWKWLLDHVMTEDKKYSNKIKRHFL